MQSIKGQLTLRGILIGCVGCVVITAASAYTALKMGALPWPIVFAAIVSLFFLKALGHGKASLNEANVTHTVMSAGAMVAGGLAFTIPGIWMLGYADDVARVRDAARSAFRRGLGPGVHRRPAQALHRGHRAGVPHRRSGRADAHRRRRGRQDRLEAVRLDGPCRASTRPCATALGVIPAMLFGNAAIPGVAFGIYNSPMLLAVGFLVGTGAVAVWFAGALLANFGIVVGGSAAGLWDSAGGAGHRRPAWAWAS